MQTDGDLPTSKQTVGLLLKVYELKINFLMDKMNWILISGTRLLHSTQATSAQKPLLNKYKE